MMNKTRIEALSDGVFAIVMTLLIMQAKVRILLTPAFAVLGIIAAFYHSSISFFLFAFPVIFNIIPGTLNFLERIFLSVNPKGPFHGGGKNS